MTTQQMWTEDQPRLADITVPSTVPSTVPPPHPHHRNWSQTSILPPNSDLRTQLGSRGGRPGPLPVLMDPRKPAASNHSCLTQLPEEANTKLPALICCSWTFCSSSRACFHRNDSSRARESRYLRSRADTFGLFRPRDTSSSVPVTLLPIGSPTRARGAESGREKEAQLATVRALAP